MTTMVSTEVRLGSPAESSTNGATTFSMPGVSSVHRPERASVRAARVAVRRDQLVVTLTDGREVKVPIAWFPRLIEASPRERGHYELIGGGTLIHWPDVDEDIDVANLLRV